ncbi:MAG: hypothetical protein M3010_02275 [Candidatus Dormibacteraeota bacterium]|nr:hypothetical protein [Candidatus Dormibacteraeota bacterium]
MSGPRPRGAVTELKIPATAQFVVVAKRAAGALGTCAGFGLAAIDDLNIAVAQACEKGIAAGDRIWGPGNGMLKLTFRLVDGGMEVEVKSLPSRGGVSEEEVRRREVDLERQAATMRRTAALLSREAMTERQLEDVAVNMIRLFVDELRYKVDAHGSMRMRMVKYLAD